MLAAMMAYREAAPPPGLPFSRKGLGGFTFLTCAVAASALFPFAFYFTSARGLYEFKNGGSGMFLLLVLALLGVAAIGVLGAFTVRGKRLPTTIIAALPAVPVIAGALLMRHAMGRAFDALSGESVDPSMTARILAVGTSEADSLVILGCYLGAAGFGAASVALLGGAGSIDRTRSAAPAGAGWILTLVLGLVGVVGAFGARLALRATSPVMLLTIPAMIIVTSVATIAAKNGPFVRGWHDRREANLWLASLLGAALAAAAGLVLLDMVAVFSVESLALGALSGESVDPSQKARILGGGVAAITAATACACVDGLFGFATIAVGLVSAIGRGPDGKTRSPIGGPALIALAAVVLAAASLFGARASLFAGVTRSTRIASERLAAPATASAVELPHVAGLSPWECADFSGPVLVVRADGTFEPSGELTPYGDNVVVFADRRAAWSAVVSAIRTAIKQRPSRTYGGLPAMAVPPGLTIRVDGTVSRPPVDLGRYDVFLGPRDPMLAVYLSSPSGYSAKVTRIAPRPADDMEAVVAAISAAKASGGADAYDAPRVVLEPPDGPW